MLKASLKPFTPISSVRDKTAFSLPAQKTVICIEAISSVSFDAPSTSAGTSREYLPPSADLCPRINIDNLPPETVRDKFITSIEIDDTPQCIFQATSNADKASIASSYETNSASFVTHIHIKDTPSPYTFSSPVIERKTTHDIVNVKENLGACSPLSISTASLSSTHSLHDCNLVDQSSPRNHAHTLDNPYSPLRQAINSLISIDNNTIRHLQHPLTLSHHLDNKHAHSFITRLYIDDENHLSASVAPKADPECHLAEQPSSSQITQNFPIAPARKKRVSEKNTIPFNLESSHPTPPPRLKHLAHAASTTHSKQSYLTLPDDHKIFSIDSSEATPSMAASITSSSDCLSPFSITFEHLLTLRKLSDTPFIPINEKEHTIIQNWLGEFVHEEQRRDHIDCHRLLELRQKIDLLHNNKEGTSAVWNPLLTHAYRQIGQEFLAAAGVSHEEQKIAAWHWAKSGEFYTASQLFVWPSRLMGAALALPEFASEHAHISWMLSRGSYHSFIGGVLSPMWDALSALAKRGQPIPSDKYWNTPHRRSVISHLNQCIKQTQQAITVFKKNGQAIPQEIETMLEEARHLYKMVNAKSYCYAAASCISGFAEFLKTTLDVIASAATASIATPVVGSITRSSTALLYTLTAPFEEWAAMDQIRTQNAKYADILKEGRRNEVDLDKVMALWQGPRQVENAYIDKSVGRKLAKYLHCVQKLEERIKFLEIFLTQPDKHSMRIYRNLTICQAEIDFIEGRLESLKPTVGKNQRGDAMWFSKLIQNQTIDPELLKELGAQPATHRNLLTKQNTDSSTPQKTIADCVQAEIKKYAHLSNQNNRSYAALEEAGELLPPRRDSDESDTTGIDIDQQRQFIHDTQKTILKIIPKLQSLSNGKKLVTQLESKLQALKEQKNELETLQQLSLSATTRDTGTDTLNTSPTSSKLLRKITHTIHQKQEEKQKYIDKIWRLSSDYQLFKAIQKSACESTSHITCNPELNSALYSLDHDSLISKMLRSRARLYWEAVKSSYAPPGTLLVRAIERAPVFLTLGTYFGLSVTPAPQLGENAHALDWVSADTPLILGQPQPTIPAEYVGTLLLAGAIQEVCRLQSYRVEHISSFLRQHNLPSSLKLTLIDTLKAIAPEPELDLESHHLQYMPDFDKIKKILQEYHLTRRHPESDRLLLTYTKNLLLASFRTAAAGIKEMFLRVPIDILGAHINRQAKSTLKAIGTYNTTLANERPDNQRPTHENIEINI